jgi:hypothetical protein
MKYRLDRELKFKREKLVELDGNLGVVSKVEWASELLK